MAELLAWFGVAGAPESAPVQVEDNASEVAVEAKVLGTRSVREHVDIADASEPELEPEPIVQNDAVPKAVETSQPRPGLRAPFGEQMHLGVPIRSTTSDAGSDSPVSTMRSLEPKTMKVALFRGPVMPYYYIGKDGLQQTGYDFNGCGLELSGQTVVTIHREGMAARWAEFKKGDKIISISGQPFEEGKSLADYLVEGKNAYLCTVERMVKSSAPLSNRAMKAVGLVTDRPRFETEEDCTEAFAHAGDYLRGLR